MEIYPLATTKTSIALLCLLLFLAPLASQAAPQPAAIRVPNPDYNFGAALQGDTIKHAFTVKNNGGQTLRIQHVRVA